MKQAIAQASSPFAWGWLARLLAPFARPRDVRHRGRADTLSSHMRRDIGLGDDARGAPLYGSVRRKL